MKTAPTRLAWLSLLAAGALLPQAARAFQCPPLPSQATDVLSAGQKRRMMELTSVFENSDPQYNYGYIEYEKDGRGYTAGRVGFCSGTNDLLQVVRLYAQYKPDNPLNSFIPALVKVDGTNSIEGLGGFPAVWQEAAADPEMVCAQDQIVDKDYYGPALKTAASLGVKSPFGKAILYDTIIMHGEGEGGDPDGLQALIQLTLRRTQGKTPRDGYDERAWLVEFLAVRKADMLNPHNQDTQENWSQNAGYDTVHNTATDTDRPGTLKNMLLSKTYDLLPDPMPLSNNGYYTGVLP